MSQPTLIPVIYQLRVFLRGISPMVWRRLLVRSDSSLADLHYTIQIAIGWTDSHLHRFRIHGQEYGMYRSGGLWFSDDPQKVPLSKFNFRIRERFLYEYDFTDEWMHEIRVEEILDLERERVYPVCVSGERASPPEGCGGPRAYMTVQQELKFQAIFGYTVHDLLEMDSEDEQEEDSAPGDYPRFNPDHFARHKVNTRLERYIRGDRDWLFEEDGGEG